MSENFLERVWAYREEKIYPELFGELGPGILTLDGGDFRYRERSDRMLHSTKRY